MTVTLEAELCELYVVKFRASWRGETLTEPSQEAVIVSAVSGGVTQLGEVVILRHQQLLELLQTLRRGQAGQAGEAAHHEIESQHGSRL